MHAYVCTYVEMCGWFMLFFGDPQVSTGIQASSESQQAHVDYLQQSLQGLSSGVGEYGVASSLATENTAATLASALSQVRVWLVLLCCSRDDLHTQHECLVRQEEQAVSETQGSVVQAIGALSEVSQSQWWWWWWWCYHWDFCFCR